MFKLLDVRFSFFCRKSHKNENGKNPIVLRISFNGDRRDLFTGLYCRKRDWNPLTQQVAASDKSSKTINENLATILRKVNHVFDSLRFSQAAFSINELVIK
jgi:hypothetical protein